MTGSVALLTTKALLFTGATSVLGAAPTPAPTDPGGQGQEFGSASPVGLVVLILFFIAVGFLVRSMTKHLKRVPESFDPPAEQRDKAEDTPEAAGETDAEAGTSRPDAAAAARKRTPGKKN